MKRILAIAGVLALGACAESAPEAEPVVEAVEEETSVDMSAWVGTYNLVYEDGTEAVLNIAEDGSYEAVMGEESIVGAITMGDGGTFCYTAEGSEEAECWTNSEAADDGSWTSTSDQGRTVTVSRVEANPEAEPAA